MPQARILIVEDIQAIRKMLREKLKPSLMADEEMNALLNQFAPSTPEEIGGESAVAERLDLTIDEAAHGGEGIEMARTAFDAGQAYDLIITDMLMNPYPGGDKLIEGVRSFDKDVPIIIHSALSNITIKALGDQFNEGKSFELIDKPMRDNFDLLGLVTAYITKKGQ